MAWKEIGAKELTNNAFTMIGSDWMLVTAEADGKANTMTASWGGMGVMWGKDVAFVVLRPQRYTKEFVDATDRLSLTFFDASHRKTLSYLGSVSGRDEDKLKRSGLTLAHDGAVPYFEEANTVLLCRKLYAQEFQPGCFLDPALIQQWYPDQDFHTLYIVEVEKVLVAE